MLDYVYICVTVFEPNTILVYKDYRMPVLRQLWIARTDLAPYNIDYWSYSNNFPANNRIIQLSKFTCWWGINSSYPSAGATNTQSLYSPIRFVLRFGNNTAIPFQKFDGIVTWHPWKASYGTGSPEHWWAHPHHLPARIQQQHPSQNLHIHHHNIWRSLLQSPLKSIHLMQINEISN